MDLDLNNASWWEIVLMMTIASIVFVPLFLFSHTINKIRKLFKYFKTS